MSGRDPSPVAAMDCWTREMACEEAACAAEAMDAEPEAGGGAQQEGGALSVATSGVKEVELVGSTAACADVVPIGTRAPEVGAPLEAANVGASAGSPSTAVGDGEICRHFQVRADPPTRSTAGRRR